MRQYVPIKFGQGQSNLVDCAVARVNEGVAIDRTTVAGLPNGQARSISGNVTAILEQERVMKVGRTTGGTAGFVSGVGINVGVFMTSQGFKQQAFFSNQIQIESDSGNFSEGGDSGSVVFNDDMDAVGLIFAGSA